MQAREERPAELDVTAANAASCCRSKVSRSMAMVTPLRAGLARRRSWPC